MKKLTKIDMKAVKGAWLPICVTHCRNEYRYCLSQGNSIATCAEERAMCLETCECMNGGLACN
jgi:hypothetical protein